MDMYSITDKSIEEELGRRLKELRLRRNLTQDELCNSVSVARATIERLEKGSGKISTLIAVMRELGYLENFDLLLPDQPASPLVLAERQGKKRERARKKPGAQPSHDTDW